MALFAVSGRREPYGWFDGKDSELSSFKGGEVVGLTYSLLTSSEQKASDVADGYVANASQKFPSVTKTITSGMRPLFLADEGTKYMGTMFGTLLGSSVGLDSTGTVIGPNTAAGSGKVTLWDGPAFYTVTTDNTDPTATTGLQPTNTTIAGNDPLYAMSTGLLTPNVAVAVSSLVVARFIEFTTNLSKVSTKLSMVSAPNSPVGSTGKKTVLDRALIHFEIET